MTRAVSNPSLAATNAFINQALKGVGRNFHREMLEKYQAVTKDEVLSALRNYVLQAFDPETSVAISVSAPGKVETTVEGLKALGFEVETRQIYVDPEELGDGEDASESESESESEGEGETVRL